MRLIIDNYLCIDSNCKPSDLARNRCKCKVIGMRDGTGPARRPYGLTGVPATDVLDILCATMAQSIFCTQPPRQIRKLARADGSNWYTREKVNRCPVQSVRKVVNSETHLLNFKLKGIQRTEQCLV